MEVVQKLYLLLDCSCYTTKKTKHFVTFCIYQCFIIIVAFGSRTMYDIIVLFNVAVLFLYLIPISV